MTKLTVRDVMDPNPVTVTTRTSFKDLAALLTEEERGAVPVLGRRGEVVGMVTEADLLKKQGLQPVPDSPGPVRRSCRRSRWTRATAASAGEVMTTRPPTIRPEAMVAEAARLMDRLHCVCLPVIGTAGELVGAVTTRDLLRVFLRPDRQIAEDVVREITAGGFAAAPGSVTADVVAGVVSLSGTARFRSMLPAMSAVIRGVDGVIDVEGQPGYAVDDLRSMAAG